MDVFESFPEADLLYTFLTVKNGTIKGDVVISESEHYGVFKFRQGVSFINGIQTTDSTSTIHVRAQDYPQTQVFEGNGIRRNGVDYKIVGSTEGRNYETNELEHYRLTLERATYGN